jgi:hypothetical protein
MMIMAWFLDLDWRSRRYTIGLEMDSVVEAVGGMRVARRIEASRKTRENVARRKNASKFKFWSLLRSPRSHNALHNSTLSRTWP